MENNDISLEIYVKDKILNKNDYELICSALKENKNILVGTKNDDERKELMTAIINKMIELVPNNPLGIIERKFPLKYKTDFYIKMKPDASVSKAISQIIISQLTKCGTNIFTLQKPAIICDTLNGDIEGTYELIKAWDFRITAGGIVGLNADSIENMVDVVCKDVVENIQKNKFSHYFGGLDNIVDLFIYFDGKTISVSSING